MPLKAVVFDLDGVLTDTAEYHYLSWKRLTVEEGLPFDRVANEALRGLPRRDSLLLILGQRQVDEESLQAMMARKNRYYQEMLAQVTPADLLPGVPELLDRLDAAGTPYAVASASRNATTVVERLGIAGRLAVIADGHSVQRQKPAPDLFRYATARLRQPPGQCLVVEDALAGIEAALAAGMPVLALGPAGRFESGLAALDGRVSRRDSLEGLRLSELQAIVEDDPLWVVVEEEFDPGRQRHKETIFTIGNGYFSSRGTFEEGYPGELALTFAHGVFDDMPVSMTELANLPNWLDLQVTVDGHDFRLDQGEVLYFKRHLDLRQGILRRDLRWQTPSGGGEGEGSQGTVIDLTFERFISYPRQHLGALRLLVTAVNQDCHVGVHASINGHVANDDLLHWRHLGQGHDENLVWLQSCTRYSGLHVGTAVALATTSDNPVQVQNCPGQPTLIVTQALAPGATLLVDKLVSYTASRDNVLQAQDVVARALAAYGLGRWAKPGLAKELVSHLPGLYDALKLEQVAAWAGLWQDIDVIVEGDDEAQLAIRFNLFQLQVAAPQEDDRVSIGAKTLSGLGYRGHVFWDTEIFILPFFIYTQPRIARNMLIYRYHTLPGARRKAAANGFSGAQYAWESALTGDEVTPTFVPDLTGKSLVRIWTGDIELHITADVAYAIIQYWQVTGDAAFMRDYGAEMILDTARFWGDRAELEVTGNSRRYAIRDVIGPDEYHDHVDNNVYTNRMAQWHLQTAFAVLDWLERNEPAKAVELTEKLQLTEELLAHWQDVIDHIIIHYDPETGLMLQFDGFFDLRPVDWSAFAGRTHSMQVLLGIEGANESQVIKQADVIMLLCLFRDEYDEQTWQVNWDTYEPITDHTYGSSLGPAFHAWAACELGKPEVAYEHFMRAARADLQDVRGNAGDGIHAASAGGLWQAVVFGFAGLRAQEDEVLVRPRLPAHWRRLAFSVYYRGRRYHVDIRSDRVR